MALVRREELLRVLESVQPGLSSREAIEQSSCFVFHKGKVITYNDEVSAQAPILDIKDNPVKLEAAIKAGPLLKLLQSMKGDELDMAVSGKDLTLKGKGKGVELHLEEGIHLAYANVEKPTEWKKLASDFGEAISIVHECAGKNEARYALTCVHVTGDWVEATDDLQAARYRIKVPIQMASLVRKEAIKHIIRLDATEFAETNAWLHFRNSLHTTLSVRRTIDPFPSISKWFKVEGKKISLPKGSTEAVETASILSGENADDNLILVELKNGANGNGRMRIVGQVVSGRYWEVRKLKYTGPNLGFLVPPELLTKIIKNHNEFEIANDRLKVKGLVEGVHKFSFVTSLGVKDDKKEKETQVKKRKEADDD